MGNVKQSPVDFFTLLLLINMLLLLLVVLLLLLVVLSCVGVNTSGDLGYPVTPVVRVRHLTILTFYFRYLELRQLGITTVCAFILSSCE